MGKRKSNAGITYYTAMYEYRKKGRRHLPQETARLLKLLKRPCS